MRTASSSPPHSRPDLADDALVLDVHRSHSTFGPPDGIRACTVARVWDSDLRQKFRGGESVLQHGSHDLIQSRRESSVSLAPAIALHHVGAVVLSCRRHQTARYRLRELSADKSAALSAAARSSPLECQPVIEPRTVKSDTCQERSWMRDDQRFRQRTSLTSSLAGRGQKIERGGACSCVSRQHGPLDEVLYLQPSWMDQKQVQGRRRSRWHHLRRLQSVRRYRPPG